MAEANSSDFVPAPLRPIKPALKRKRRIVPDDQRKRISVSCDRCRKRKLRCRAGDESKPLSEHDTCTECIKANSTCTRTLPRKKRVYGSVDVLSIHYQTLLELVKKLFPDQDCETVPGLLELAKSNGIKLTETFAPQNVPESAFLAPKRDVVETAVAAATTSNTASAAAVANKPAEIVFADPPRMLSPSAEKQLQQSQAFRTVKTEAPDASFDIQGTRPETVITDRKPAPDLGTERIIYDRVGVPYYVGTSGSMAFFDSLCKIIGKKNDSHAHPEPSDNLRGDVSSGTEMNADASNSNGSVITRSDDKGVFFYTISASSISDSANMPLPDKDQVSLLPPKEECDVYIQAFMDNINPIFPFFRVKRFQAKYEKYWADITGNAKQKSHWQSRIDWRCCLYMVLVMGSRSLIVSKETSRKYGSLSKYASVVQGALSILAVTNTLETVQALFLLSYYFHGVNERNAAWLMTGITCRQAMAMGLHRESACASCSPEEAQLRRQIWFSLYSFELALCANLGRPSCIRHDDIDVNGPNEYDEELSIYSAPGTFIYNRQLSKYFYEVNLHMGEFKDLLTKANIDYTLNFARQLKDFLSSLPRNLVELSPTLSKYHARSILKIHMRTHYTISILSRPFVLYLAGTDLTQIAAPKLQDLVLILNIGCASAIAISQILTTMNRRGLVNGVYHTDIFYGYCACLVLSLISVTVSSGKCARNRLAYSKETINSAIRSIVNVMDSMYLEGTMFRIAKVTASILRGLDINIKASQTIAGPGSQQDPVSQSSDAISKPKNGDDDDSSFDPAKYQDALFVSKESTVPPSPDPSDPSLPFSNENFPQALLEEYEKMFMPREENDTSDSAMDKDFSDHQHASSMLLEDVDLFTETFNNSFYDVSNSFNFSNITFNPADDSDPNTTPSVDSNYTKPSNENSSRTEPLVNELIFPTPSSNIPAQSQPSSTLEPLIPAVPSYPTGNSNTNSLDALYNHGDVGVISNMSWLREDHGKSQLMDYVKQKSKPKS